MHDAELIARDIDAYLERHARKEILRFLTAGSVDDGKSTLIGRLLHDANQVYEDQLEALKRDSAKKSSAGGDIDYSLLVDGLLSEREQGITIDVAYRYFTTARRKFIIADTPGHEQYTRNMATGASTADLAIILVDARQGVLAQTRRHSYIASLLGIRHVVVAVNKMDLVGYDEAVFRRIERDYLAFAQQLGFGDIYTLPLSALRGENVVTPSASMPWHAGPALLEHLETVPIAHDRNLTDFRFPVQYVLRPNLDFRGFCGTVASGVVRRGDAVVALPSGRRTRVKSVVTYDGELEEARAPLAVTLTLEDEIDLSRGETLAREGNLPTVGRAVDATVVWMHEQPMRPGATYLLKHGTNVVSAEVAELRHKVDVATLETRPARELGLNDIGRVTLVASRVLMFDPYRQNRATGAFVLIDRMSNATVGAGMIEGPGAFDAAAAATGAGARRGDERVSLAERARRLGQVPAAVWLVDRATERAGAIARALERRLFDEGYAAHVVDAATLGVDGGAASDLARRAREAAELCTGLGMITIAVVPTREEGDDAGGARRAGAQYTVVEVEPREVPGVAAPAASGARAADASADAGALEIAPETAVEAAVERLVKRLRARGVVR